MLANDGLNVNALPWVKNNFFDDPAILHLVHYIQNLSQESSNSDICFTNYKDFTCVSGPFSGTNN